MTFINSAKEYFRDYSNDDFIDLFQNIQEKIYNSDLELIIDRNFNIIETLSYFKSNSEFIEYMYENDNHNFIAAIIYNNCILQSQEYGLGIIEKYNILEENMEDYDIEEYIEDFSYNFMYEVVKCEIETKHLKYIYEYSSGQEYFLLLGFNNKY